MRFDETPAVRSTIFALSSGQGKAGVAVVRLSGPDASVAVTRLAGRLPEPRMAAYRRLKRPDGEVIDDALVLWFPGPRSETGEDQAEFQVHGSRAVLAALFQELSALPGLRLAEPGEFARRAFLNGKLDLTAVEGLADLIDAETEAQRRQAVTQAAGGLARLYRGWRADLLQAMALLEASIDFSDEGDVGGGSTTEAAAGDAVRDLVAKIERHLADGHRGELIRNGFRVVLAGPPNVGKSSLLNALARRDVAIVSEEAGTTRDVLDVRLDLGGMPVVVSDTAGLRDASGAVEREGMRRTLKTAAEADLVLWVVDATDPVWDPATTGGPELSARRRLVVLNKTDRGLPIGAEPVLDPIRVSALTGEGMADLVGRIGALAGEAGGGASDEPWPTNARHRRQLEMALGHLRDAVVQLGPPGPAPEFAAEHLRLASAALGRLIGAIDPEDVLGEIFGRFCIGK